MALEEKKCVPCEGGVNPLSHEKAEELLVQTDGWEIVEEEGILTLQKNSTFKDFKEVMEFVNKLAELAEKEGHHPNILIHGYKNVRTTFYTHAIKGLHENDFIMAAKTNLIS